MTNYKPVRRGARNPQTSYPSHPEAGGLTMGNHRLAASPMDDRWDDGAWTQDEIDRDWVQREIDARIRELGGRSKPSVVVRGTVIAALLLALGAAGFGISMGPSKEATHVAPLTATPPAPATVDPVPDAPMDVPPVLTPSLTHGHPSRLVHSQTSRVQVTADTSPAAAPTPVEAPAPVAAPVPEQTSTTVTPSITWVPQYPTYQRHSQRSGSSSHHLHHRSRDLDHDGDNR